MKSSTGTIDMQMQCISTRVEYLGVKGVVKPIEKCRLLHGIFINFIVMNRSNYDQNVNDLRHCRQVYLTFWPQRDGRINSSSWEFQMSLILLHLCGLLIQLSFWFSIYGRHVYAKIWWAEHCGVHIHIDVTIIIILVIYN